MLLNSADGNSGSSYAWARLLLCAWAVAVCLLSLCDGVTAAETGLLAVPAGQERVCLSLRALSREVDAATAEKRSLPEECLTMAGISYLEAFVVDDSGDGDMILIGLRSGARPSLRLDDLLVVMRSLDSPDEQPYCSLDPLPSDVRALRRLSDGSTQSDSAPVMRQQIVVGGVPRDSRFAHVMIEADYHMKQVSLGRASVGGLTSYLDLCVNRANVVIGGEYSAQPPEPSFVRLWFHLAPGNPAFLEGPGVVWLSRCSIAVMTETEAATSTGDLVDLGKEDPVASAFAQQFSSRFGALAASFPAYANLENIYRLRALLLAMDFRNSLFIVGLDPESFLKQCRRCDDSPMPDFLPGLTNSRELMRGWARDGVIGGSSLRLTVCGGVGMDMEVGRSSFRRCEDPDVASLQTAALAARPSGQAFCWPLGMGH